MTFYTFDSIGIMNKHHELPNIMRFTKGTFIYDSYYRRWGEYSEIVLHMTKKKTVESWVPIPESEVPEEYRARILLIT